MYPSDDSPQATAHTAPGATSFKCIRATIPHKPQQVGAKYYFVKKCIRATIPHKPQLARQTMKILDECIRATIPHKPQPRPDDGLTTEQKAELEILLLTCWREDLGLDDRRLADACPRIRSSGQLGRAYRRLETWLHDPKHTVAVEDLLEDLSPSASDGKPHTRPPVPS